MRTSSIAPNGAVREAGPRPATESTAIGVALVQRVRERSIPPDDAYWWTRVLCEMTRKSQLKEPAAVRTDTPVTNVLTIVVLCFLPALASAQTGPCPTSPGFQDTPAHGCFTPILAEHTAPPDPVNGAQKVTRYDVLYFAEGADVTTASPIQTTAIGKPAPNAQGAIWFGTGTPTPLPAYPLGQRLKAVVVAVGSGGSSPRGAANTSNPFGAGASVTAPSAPTAVSLVP